ncbi:MAG: non-heme iron oxygenase ferredoxin subunit [Gammaproteobacteria bacterium]|nr:non-heme iron oxygenase ferredoxin subunit [Gammaproteobacteria bacterium]
MKAFEIEGRRLLLVFTNEEYFVVDEMCTHEDYSLALGCIKNGQIKCSLHGSYFDLQTGQPNEEPADEPICSYAVKVADGKVMVNPAQRRN